MLATSMQEATQVPGTLLYVLLKTAFLENLIIIDLLLTAQGNQIARKDMNLYVLS